ncbi:uncharacterized protein LOC134654355 [Cydia amplana]|uniref:uncharacterized protein LOC134654355 n=1 Tax=Cydia amplana TaxID=1869771 RepID=UPI002FE56E0D
MAGSTTSNVIKCKSCNIVICEVLAFIQNKQNVMDAESLVRLCTSAFSQKEIEDAKSLLFDSLSTKEKKVLRKNAGKTMRDLNDVISIFRKTDPEELPTFVARDLHRLPPLTFDHIDCTRILKDIIILKNEISSIKNTYATEQQLNDIRNELLNLKQGSLMNTYDLNVNRKRGGGGIKDSFYLNSGPYGLPPFTENVTVGSSSTPNSNGHTADRCAPDTSASRMLSPSLQRKSHTPERQSNVSREKETAINDDALMHTAREKERESAPAEGVWPKLPTATGMLNSENLEEKEVTSKEDWTKVVKKSRKSRLIVSEGKAAIKVDGKFKAVERSVPLFINKVDKQTTGTDIIEYIREETGVVVDLKTLI